MGRNERREEQTGPAEHGFDGAGGEGVLALDDELVTVGADQLDVHGVGPLTAAVHFGRNRVRRQVALRHTVDLLRAR